MQSEALAYKKEWQAAQQSRLDSGVEEDSFVYLHVNADDGVPHHVGIGFKKSRPWNLKRNDKHRNKVAKHGLRVEIVADNLTWEQACFWEVHWIKALRAAGYELTNLTDGGDGSRGYKHTTQDIEKMSQIQRGRVKSGNYVAPLNRPGVREAHLESTQSEEFKAKQRARIATEGNILDRPGSRENHLASVQSDDFREIQRRRIEIEGNPINRPGARENHASAIQSPEYKAKKLEAAPRGESHYMAKNPEAGIAAGRRLQELLTKDIRVENAKKGWATRRENIAKKGFGYVVAKSEKAIASAKTGGKRLQENLTQEIRVENAKKGWEKRYKRYQYWGA